MPQTGSQILSYSGDKNLGLGSNPQIPAIDTSANLNPINEAGRTAMLLNHENNIKLYDQKIADRDKLYSLLDQSQIDARNLNALEEDRPVLNRLRDRSKEAFYDMINKGGLNNPKAYADYKDQIKNYNDAAINANARYIGVKQLEGEKANEVLKSHQDAYQNHINKQIGKGIYGLVDPYQKSLDFDHDKMNALSLKNALVTAGQISPDQAGQTATTKYTSTTVKTDKNGNPIPTTKVTVKEAPIKQPIIKNGKTVPISSGMEVKPDGTLNEFSATPEKHIDYGTILANTTDAFLHDEEQQQYQNMWKSYFESGDPYSAKVGIDHANQRINQYNQERGLTEADKDFVSPFVVGKDVAIDSNTGKVKINVSTPEFQAKMALASVDGSYVEKPQAVFNKDIGNYNIQKERASSDSFYKHAMAGAANTKARAYAANLHQQMKLRKTAAEQDNFLDEIYTRNILQQPLIEGKGDNKVSLSFIPANRSLPVFTLDGKTPKQLIPIGATPVYDRYIYNSDGKKTDEPEKGAKITHYEGGHYEPEYVSNGRTLTPDNIRDNYLNFKKIAGKNWDGGIEDYLKLQVGKNNYDVKIRGANGTTDRGLSLAAQRIISNQATKKGQTAIFDNDQPPLDEQITEESSRTTDSDNSSNPNSN